MFNKDDIDKIDLSQLSKHITDSEFRKYFMSEAGIEHYKLLAYISNLYNNTVLYDLGTYRGCSAIALSYNQTNIIKSFDIDNLRSVENPPENIEWNIGNFLDTDIETILSSPFIMLDIDHTGIIEKQILDFLLENAWKGILLIDDIRTYQPMKDFWNQIEQEKYDITHLGHWSGTGLVKL